MTVLAFQVRMGADQGEARLLAVIEPRGLPAAHRMAGGAVGAAIPVMDIVGGVTGDARLWRALESIGDVALGASERTRARPAAEIRSCRDRNACATRSRSPWQAAQSRPSLPPWASSRAWHPAHWRGGIAVALPRCMARGAGQSGMCAPQWEVREIVIEARRIELHDVRIAAQVIGVTGAALGGCDRRGVAVQAAPLADIRRNPFVAVEAQAGLPAAVAQVVAERAMLLELLVRFGQLAWHEQRLGVDGLNPAHVQRQGQTAAEAGVDDIAGCPCGSRLAAQ